MAQTPAGALKVAAARTGLAVEDYSARVSAGLKFCWKCRQWVSRSRFCRDRSRFDGLGSACSTCRRGGPKQLVLVRPTAAELERFRYATDEAYRTERRQRVHARRRGIAPMPLEGIRELAEQFAGRCAYCPAVAETWDHIVPVSKGGRTEPGNMLPACRSCNSRKGNRDVFDFIDAAAVDASQELLEALALAAEWGQLQ